MSPRNAAPSSTGANRSVGLSALRGVEAAELLRVVTTLHLEGLLSDAEFRVTRDRLVALH